MTFRFSTLATLACLAAFACSGSGVSSSASRSFDLPVEQKVDAIVSIFENSTPELQYGYIAALGDARGYTAGRAGFTTATGDLLEVVKRYQSKSPKNAAWPRFQALLPVLTNLANADSGDISDLTTLPQAWKDATQDPLFTSSQDEITNELYRAPARRYCANLGFASPLSFLIMYDTIIQHGKGGDDGIDALIGRTPASNNEKKFLTDFLKVRRADLMNPANSDTADEWRESVGRVDALQALVDADKWDLTSPIRITVFGDTYAL